MWRTKYTRVSPPTWVTQLLTEVCEYTKLKPIPYLIWKTHERNWTSGYANYTDYTILLRAGTDAEESKMVLLHEVTHHLCCHNVQHSETFWRKALGLYKHFGLNMEKCLAREGSIWKGPSRVYEKMVSRNEL
jgi:hypothetical protein